MVDHIVAIIATVVIFLLFFTAIVSSIPTPEEKIRNKQFELDRKKKKAQTKAMKRLYKQYPGKG